MITAKEILSIVGGITGVGADAIISPSRKGEVSKARQIAVKLIRKYTAYSSTLIGIILSNRDHSTILSELGVWEDRYILYPEFRKLHDSCESAVNEAINKSTNNLILAG